MRMYDDDLCTFYGKTVATQVYTNGRVEVVELVEVVEVMVVHPRESGGGGGVGRDGDNGGRGCTPTGEWRWWR